MNSEYHPYLLMGSAESVYVVASVLLPTVRAVKVVADSSTRKNLVSVFHE